MNKVYIVLEFKHKNHRLIDLFVFSSKEGAESFIEERKETLNNSYFKWREESID
jgi:hypothetical protein